LLKRASAYKISTSAVFSTALWFVKKSVGEAFDGLRLQNLHCAIALCFLCVLCAWNGSLKVKKGVASRREGIT
jgi:hypothetical protein